MSDVNLDFTVSNNTIDFTVQPNDITITPTDIQLTFNPAITLYPGNSSPTELLYNNMNTVDGIPTVTYNGSNLSLGNVANVKITGGTNGYVLQTDGTGNLDWTAMTGGGGGNGTPGGSNTQIQYNDSGLFGGNAGFTFNEITGNVNIPGNLIVAGVFAGSIANANYASYAGNVVISSQANITSLGNLTNLTVEGMTTIQEAKEKVTTSSAPASGTINFDLLTQAIVLNTANAIANFTLNIRGNSSITLDSIMSSNQSATLRFINTNGATGYYANTIQVDGSNVTPLWVNGIPPSIGITNGKDAYDFNIIKTAANTYSILASKTGYK